MKKREDKKLQHIQNGYLKLLNKYEKIIESSQLKNKDISLMIDDLSLYWIKHKKLIQYELINLTKNNECSMLCGITYLNLSNKEHYYFKTLGRYHIINDPLYKMKTFFSKNMDICGTEMIDIFKNAYYDCKEVIYKYNRDFLILPISLVTEEFSKENINEINIFYWKFISSIFKNEINNIDELSERYETYEELEANMDKFILENLLFCDIDDSEYSLRERVNRYFKINKSVTYILKNKSEIEVFNFIMYGQISQLISSIQMCVHINVNCFIRSEVVFRYFSILIRTLIEDDEFRCMCANTVLFYVFYTITSSNIFNEIDYYDYSKCIESSDILSNVLKRLDENKIDIFNTELSKVSDLISEEFNKSIDELIK